MMITIKMSVYFDPVHPPFFPQNYYSIWQIDPHGVNTVKYKSIFHTSRENRPIQSELLPTTMLFQSGVPTAFMSSADGLFPVRVQTRMESLQGLEGVVHSESALRENNVALAILENLDWYWFWDNMLLSHAKIIKPLGFSTIALQPIQSLEMVDMSSRHSFLDLKAEKRDKQIKKVVSCHISGETGSSSKEPLHPIMTKVPKLETVPSSSQLEELALVNKPSDIPKKRLGQRDQRIGAKSTRYLELYELKGFMDLGFRFNMDSLSPRIVSVISGLQQLGEQPRTQAPTISRPYLSEAWLKQRPHIPLPSWQTPQSYEQGVEMKKCLMFWARAVASTVRQEC